VDLANRPHPRMERCIKTSIHERMDCVNWTVFVIVKPSF
jgi:hypothetical protein